MSLFQTDPQPSLDAHDPWAPARLYTLENHAGLRVQVLDQGATWVSCSVPMPDGSRREVLLGCADLADYEAQDARLGATIGLDSLDGCDRRRWQLECSTPQMLELSLVSPDGDQGEPGEVVARVRYTLGANLSLEIAHEVTSTRACPVNLASHAYFNLDGDQGCATPSALKQHLQVMAPAWLPTGPDRRPASALQPVDGTGFDLRDLTCLQDAIDTDLTLGVTKGFDHSLALDPECRDALRAAARLLAADGRVVMSIATDLPALHVHTGQNLGTVISRDGFTYSPQAGITLCPQYLPGSASHAVELPHWPDSVVRPGEKRRHCVRYFFDVG